MSFVLELQREIHSQHKSIYFEESRKLLVRKLPITNVMAGSFQRHCLSTGKGCHKEKGLTELLSPPEMLSGRKYQDLATG